MPTWKQYGVKTLYRTTARGKPKRIDRFYDAKATSVEERVVGFRARSFAEAIRLAEAEARNYVADLVEYENPYGQIVRKRYLGACDAFHLFDGASAVGEVYSRTELVSSAISDRAVIDALLGRDESAGESECRRKFDVG